MRLRHALAGLASVLLLTFTGHAGLNLRSSGMSGYSGNPATNNGRICTTCHSGGSGPSVSMSGPSMVEVGSTSAYSLLIQGGQKVAGGFDVSATQGTLVASESGTQLMNGEVTHTRPRSADAAGDVTFQWDWTAPATAGTVTMYGAGNSVDLDGDDDGDNANSDSLQVQVVDCMAKFGQYDAGTAGSGGFVPDLSGTDSECRGGYTIQVSGGLGSAPGFFWVAGSPATIPFACGNILVNLADPLFTSIRVKLGGSPGVAGVGSLNLGGPDVSALAGLDLYLQGLFFDAGACQGVALSNGLLMDIG